MIHNNSLRKPHLKTIFFIIPTLLVILAGVIICLAFIDQSGFSSRETPEQQQSVQATSKTEITDSITFRLIPGPGKTWGYEILVNDQLFIHQTCIPGVPGNDGFRKKEYAEKVARLVVLKIKNREMPPAVTEQELRDLRAI